MSVFQSRALLFGLLLHASSCNLPISEYSTPTPFGSPHTTTDKPGEAISHFGLGRKATTAEIEAWNIDIMPDGEGLPDGSGSAAVGRGLYQAQCQHCHGKDGRGGPFDPLAGGPAIEPFPFALDPRARRTIGNYWPFATTIFDYTRRAMPQDRPGSLSDDDIYSLTAYLLYLNDLVDEKTILNRETLPKIVMPARDHFVPDSRRGGPEIR